MSVNRESMKYDRITSTMKGCFSLILFLSLSLASSVWADPEIRAYLDAERSKLPPKTVSEVEETGKKIRTLVRDQNYYIDLFFEHLNSAFTTAVVMGGERNLDSAERAHNTFYLELEEATRYIVQHCKESSREGTREEKSDTLCNSVKNETQKITNEILKQFPRKRIVQELPVEYDIKYCYYALKDEKNKEIERHLELSFENVNIGFEHPINKGVFLYDDFFRESAPEKSSSPLTLHVSINHSDWVTHLESASPGFSNSSKTQVRNLNTDPYFVPNLVVSEQLPLKIRIQRGIRSLQLQFADQNAAPTSTPVLVDEFELAPTLRKSEYCSEATNQRDISHRKAIIKFPKPIHLWAY
ncbi:MAG TPA: hypothetical protein VJB34_00540 [Bdellovibrionota bacterium]|nr:hypothetical protein [Bdellovibrionota bacterium]